MDPASVQTVVLAAGSSVRMGRDKLVAPFAGVPLARRVVGALAPLGPLVVTTPAVAEAVGEIPGVRFLLTPPTDGPGLTLALADAAVPPELHLAVLACDLPFIDAGAVTAFLAAVPEEADLAFPEVDGTPGHPVVWSPAARRRIPGLRPDEPPAVVRRDRALRVLGIALRDERYVIDVDTSDAWAAAERRAAECEGREVR
ncbi:MAG TPA: nucleotidyltransferase family protein [Candidatus Elarobacter sp.]